MSQITSNAYDKLFVGGDLSGIQKFLYNITTKKAAVSLKGRSNYLRSYMEKVCQDILQLPEIASGNSDVIYCSGGKFYIIVQNSPLVQQAINEYARKAKSEIWKEHFGQLSINISTVPFSENCDGSINANGQGHQKLGYLWQCMTADFNRQKNQKFIEQIIDDYDSLFEVKEVGGNPRICAVTGIESVDCVPFRFNDSDEEIFVLPSVKKQIQLGEHLRDTEHFRTFEEYADNSYLGILRMDVDGLGKRFAEGFETFPKYKDFSSKLDAYFTSTPERISCIQAIQAKEEFRDDMNLIYAGGDDIFAIGRWDKVIDFAAYVSQDFVRYIEVPGVTLSGGVAIVHPKFPIAKAAELAGEAEDAAKDYKSPSGEMKNAFCMFGQCVSWKEEFGYVKSYKDEFVNLVTSCAMPRGILHKIMAYFSMATAINQEGSQDYSYLWHSAYYLTRMMDRQKENARVVEFCKRLRDKELYGSVGRFRLVALAARWAEQTLRMNNNN